jgi:hypothetical protein
MTLPATRVPESIRRGRAHPLDICHWAPELRTIRTCYHCKAVYLNAGYAWRCEHWHEAHSLP